MKNDFENVSRYYLTPDVSTYLPTYDFVSCLMYEINWKILLNYTTNVGRSGAGFGPHVSHNSALLWVCRSFPFPLIRGQISERVSMKSRHWHLFPSLVIQTQIFSVSILVLSLTPRFLWSCSWSRHWGTDIYEGVLTLTSFAKSHHSG